MPASSVRGLVGRLTQLEIARDAYTIFVHPLADQTPTPTRFIRNCEEVGLFQDLQVNPFEETFRRAVEEGNTGALTVPEARIAFYGIYRTIILAIIPFLADARVSGQAGDV